MKELLAVERELKEIQEDGNKRVIEYQAEIKAAQNIKDGGNK